MHSLQPAGEDIVLNPSIECTEQKWTGIEQKKGKESKGKKRKKRGERESGETRKGMDSCAL